MNINKKQTIVVFSLRIFFIIILSFFISLFLISISSAKEVGENEVFLVDSFYDSEGRSNITATLREIGDSSYFYVEDSYYNNFSRNSKIKFDLRLKSLVLDFDSTVYPETKKAFGSEWNPGIDNDKRITILFTETKDNIGGYFNPNNEYYKNETINEESNEREMIYLNISFINDNRIKSFFAHEFQHMITWYHKTKLKNIIDDIWLNEARSEYASTAIGYDDDYEISNLKSRIDNFKVNPIDSLTEWQGEIEDYSSVNLFSQYLADRFKGEIFKRMIDNNKIGIQSINKALSDLYYRNDTFQSVFEDWVITNYTNGILEDDKYSYQNKNISYENFHIEAQEKNIYELNSSGIINIENSIKDWSNEYYKFNIENYDCENESKIRISFNGQDIGNFSFYSLIFYENGENKLVKLDLDEKQDASFYISCFDKKIDSLVIIPISHKKNAGFGNNIGKFQYIISVRVVNGNKYKNNFLLESLESGKVYLTKNGQKHWIATSEDFVESGYQWEDIIIVTEIELELYENGENFKMTYNSRLNGGLVRGLDYPEVYLIKDSQKHWIPTVDIFIANGYQWEDVVIITNEELEAYSFGKNIEKSLDLELEGHLVKGLKEKVYLIKDNQKHWIITAEAFIANGYCWDDITIVLDSWLDSRQNGIDIVLL